MTVLSVPDGFAIATPADWLVFDFDALQDEVEVSAFLGGRVAEIPDMEQHRDQLLALLLGAGRQAEAAGVVLGAVMVSARADGVPIVASLSIATIDRDANADALAELSPQASAEVPSQAPTNGNTDRTVGLRLPAGQAARFDRVTHVPLPCQASVTTVETALSHHACRCGSHSGHSDDRIGGT